MEDNELREFLLEQSEYHQGRADAYEEILNKISEEESNWAVSLCNSCHCLTKTIDGKCGKCAVMKECK